jgi:ABC-type nitrate/sulfonate/bicarbonate transport system substrate-binding protein
LIKLAALLFFAVQARSAGLEKIRIAFPSVGTVISGNIGVTLQKTGILEKHGFGGVLTPLPLGRELKEAFAAGQVDVIFTSEANFIVLLGQGVPCRAIGTFGSMGEMGLVVKPASAIRKLSDLKGKKLATIFGTSLHEPAVDWPREAGLDPRKDVELVNMRGIGPLNAAFASGDVDAIVTFDPYLTQGVKKGEYRVLRKAGLDGIVLMSGAYAAAHPGSAERFNEALREAIYYVASHQEATNTWAGELSGMPAELLAEASKANANYNAKKISDVDLTISQAYRKKLARLGRFFFEQRLIPVKPDVLSSIDNGTTER